MGELPTRHVLIVGAGAMGIVYGYLLSLVGAEVTFLIRPHRVEALSHPQVLYSYNDHQLKTFTDYKCITSPSEIVSASYDYIIVTLDGCALQNEVGQSLVQTIGKAVKGTKTKVVLCGIMLDLKSWFLQLSGLDTDQVATALFYIHAYEPKRVTLPLHEPTNPELLAQADIAYHDAFPTSITIYDGTPELWKGFAELFNVSGATPINMVPTEQMNLMFMPFFAVFVASELLGWPKFRDIGSKGEIWSLAVAAVREVQQLNMCGPAGKQTAEATNEAGLAATLTGMEEILHPLDMQSFNKYHHGGKVSAQDRQLLQAYVAQGEAEGKSMSSLKELLARADRKVNGN